MPERTPSELHQPLKAQARRQQQQRRRLHIDCGMRFKWGGVSMRKCGLCLNNGSLAPHSGSDCSFATGWITVHLKEPTASGTLTALGMRVASVVGGTLARNGGSKEPLRLPFGGTIRSC